MKLPRNVSGERLAATLCRDWHYRKVDKSGSHIILDTDEPTHRRISVPDHPFLRVGTFNSVLRAVTREAIILTL
jgi:predicted RNA binding protein YcfA (HicA-like mRNA interferase family)